MNCFMSYNPNVAKEVKVTTWIKEFDGASPVYPSFPNEGDVFIVFDNDEATEPSVNKTYTSGDWADTSSGDAPTGTIYITENGEGIDVSSYATADVNVSGGGGVVTIPIITVGGTQEEPSFSCDVTYTDFLELIHSSTIADSDGHKHYTSAIISGYSSVAFSDSLYTGDFAEGYNYIVMEFQTISLYYLPDGTITLEEPSN